MAFTLYALIQAALLCVNAVAVLNEERFLAKVGWATEQSVGGFGDEPGIKSQLINLIKSVRTLMRKNKRWCAFRASLSLSCSGSTSAFWTLTSTRWWRPSLPDSGRRRRPLSQRGEVLRAKSWMVGTLTRFVLQVARTYTAQKRLRKVQLQPVGRHRNWSTIKAVRIRR
ncbi:unnamed protein product [Lampetra planeri]